MDFIFIKSSKAGKEDYGSIYARVRSGKANMKVVTGFTIKQLEWEKYRSLQYTSSALMSSIGIKYGQFAQVLARIKAAFEADGFNPKEAKNIIESVKHDVLNGMMQIVEVKPKGKMLFEDFLTSYIEDMETGRRTKKGRTVKVSPAYIKGLRIIQKQILNLFLELQESDRMSIMMVTHDIGVAAQVADQIAIMYGGIILECGATRQVLETPANPYTKALIAALPKSGNRERLVAIEGQPPTIVHMPPGCPFSNRCAYATEACRQSVPELKPIDEHHMTACHMNLVTSGGK